METPDARALLEVVAGASEAEIKAAYRDHIIKVQKRFDDASDNRTREKCKRERRDIDEARRILMFDLEDQELRRREEAERVAAEERQREEAERLAAEQHQREEAKRLAAEKRRHEEAERLATEKRQREEAERLATEKRQREENERLGAEQLQREEGKGSPPKRRWSTWLLILAPVAAVIFFWSQCQEKTKLSKVVVNTVPDKADVWLDGVPQGKTPIILENIAPGDRRLKIELPGYKAQELIVSIKPGDQGVNRTVRLVPVEQSTPNPTPTQTKLNPSKFVLNTVPDTADVWLDGVPRGKTPIVFENIAPGDRRLKIQLPGYKTQELIVSIKPGNEESNRTVQLVPIEPPAPKPTPTQSIYNGERYPQTRERLLTESEIANWNYAELRYAINEMCARHGLPVPNEPDIEAQFRKFEWYHPVPGRTEAQIEVSFSWVEKSNIQLLTRMRDEKRP